MECIKCDYDNPSGAKFCIRCGEVLSAASDNIENLQPANFTFRLAALITDLFIVTSFSVIFISLLMEWVYRGGGLNLEASYFSRFVLPSLIWLMLTFIYFFSQYYYNHDTLGMRFFHLRILFNNKNKHSLRLYITKTIVLFLIIIPLFVALPITYKMFSGDSLFWAYEMGHLNALQVLSLVITFLNLILMLKMKFSHKNPLTFHDSISKSIIYHK